MIDQSGPTQQAVRCKTIHNTGIPSGEHLPLETAWKLIS